MASDQRQIEVDGKFYEVNIFLTKNSRKRKHVIVGLDDMGNQESKPVVLNDGVWTFEDKKTILRLTQKEMVLLKSLPINKWVRCEYAQYRVQSLRKLIDAGFAIGRYVEKYDLPIDITDDTKVIKANVRELSQGKEYPDYVFCVDYIKKTINEKKLKQVIGGPVYFDLS